MTVHRSTGFVFLVALLAVSAFTLLPAQTHAKEVEAGTLITAENLSQMKQNTFMGKNIGDMLPSSTETAITDHGMRIRLGKPTKFPLSDRWKKVTQMEHKHVSLNPEKQSISGWKAGLPFPGVTADSEHAALKAHYNYYYGRPKPDMQNQQFNFIFIGQDGFEREQNWIFQKYWTRGQLYKHSLDYYQRNNYTEGSGDIYFKQILMALAPYDIKGVGTFTIRYMGGRFDDIWAYIRSVRRTRRLTGGGWYQPIGGSDLLNDEVNVESAHPTWNTKYELLGKKTILVAADGGLPTMNDNAKKPSERHFTLDWKGNPMWHNPNEIRFEPRQVWHYRIYKPKEHPYKYKEVYLDSDMWFILQGDDYDRDGDLAKIFYYTQTPNTTPSGFDVVTPPTGTTVDLKARHATPYNVTWMKPNQEGITADEVSLQNLKRGRPAQP